MTRHTFDNGLDLIPGSIPNTGSSNLAGCVYDLKSKAILNNVQETWAFTLMQDNVTTVASTYHVFFRTLIALS